MDLNARVTATEAEKILHGVSRHLIGMWKLAGKVTPVGKRGRSPLYRLGDLIQVEKDARATKASSRWRPPIDRERAAA